MLSELVLKNRSCRRFYQNHKIKDEVLINLVDLARICPSAANLQPLKYYISNKNETNKKIFSTLAWAGYLKDWPGPCEEEKPASYIIILKDTTISDNCDCDSGISAQTILLGAREKGLGGCMIAAVSRKKLKKNLNIADHLEILLVIAIGKPKEDIIIEKVDSSNSIKYWRDTSAVHHVPKRTLNDIIIK